MSLVLRNVIATFMGTAWVGVMSVVLAPYVIHHLGVEAYGLLGIFVTLQGIMMPIGTGLSSVLMREVARLRTAGDARGERELVSTVELLYFASALVIIVVMVAAAPYLARMWVNPQTLSVESVVRALRYIAVAVALQLPIAGYTGSLMGLQRHVVSNTVTSVAVTARVVVAVMLLNIVPSTDWFFGWQAVATVAHVVALRVALWRSLPRAAAQVFNVDVVVPLAGFARGVVATTVLGTVLAQIDKIVLARMVSLAEFGRYMLAATLAAGTGVIVSAVSLAFFPRLASAIARSDTEDLAVSYHRAAQLMSVLLVPVGLVIAVFGADVLRIWTGEAALAASSAGVVALLVLGSTLNGLVAVPYAVQIASGWPELSVRINIVATVLVVPAMIVAAQYRGGIGTAAVWLVLNAVYLLVGVPLMYRCLLKSEQATWWRVDVIAPAAAATVVVVVCRMAAPIATSRVAAAFELAAITCAAALAALLTTPLVRSAILDAIAFRSSER